jgi:hypothetical protein
VAGGVYLIDRNWDKIVPYFQQIWEGIKASVSTVWDWFKAAFAWTPLGMVVANWSAISAALSAPVEAGKALVQAAWQGVKTLFSWTPLGLIVTHWEGISQVMSAPVEAGVALIETSWDAIVGALPSIEWASMINLEGIKSAWNGVTGWLGDVSSDLWDIIPDMPDFKMPAFLGGDKEVADPKTILEAAKAAQTLEEQYPALSAAAQRALKGTNAAVNSIGDLLSQTSFNNQGVALMRTLAQGIRAGTHLVVAATASAAQQVRDHLPSSPAKTGPLSDIHRLKFGETIASSIRSEPMVKAMRIAAAATMTAAMPLTQDMAIAATAVSASAARSVLPSAQEARSASTVGPIAKSGGAGSEPAKVPVSVTFGDTHINGGSPTAQRELRETAAEERRKFVRLLESHNADEQRKEF